MKPRCLFKVSDAIEIRGHGIALFPGIIAIDDEKYRIGTVVELHRPNGSVVQTKIAGIELGTPIPKDHSFIIILKEPSCKEDIPIGTEVWSVEFTLNPRRPGNSV